MTRIERPGSKGRHVRIRAVHSFYTSHGVRHSMPLRRGTLSAGAHSRGTTETMIVRSDSNVSQIIKGIDVEDSFPPAMDAIDADGIAKLLVEIAIVDLSVPTDVDRVEAHELLDGIGIEVPDQQIHVLGELSPPVQKVGEPLDGHVGDGVELIKENSKVLGQLCLVLDLQFFLWWWQKGTQGIVDQIELKAWAVLVLVFQFHIVFPVSRFIESEEGCNRSFKDSPAPLGVDVFGRIAREARDDVNIVLFQKLYQIFLPRFLQDREVAPVDDDQILSTNGPCHAN